MKRPPRTPLAALAALAAILAACAPPAAYRGDRDVLVPMVVAAQLPETPGEPIALVGRHFGDGAHPESRVLVGRRSDCAEGVPAEVVSWRRDRIEFLDAPGSGAGFVCVVAAGERAQQGFPLNLD